MTNIKKLFFLITKKEINYSILLLLMMVILAFLEMIGVASVMPFITVLTNPNLVETNTFLKILFEYSFMFGIENIDEFLFFLGIIVFFVLVLALTFRALTNYLQIRFVYRCEYTISKRLLEGYIHKPYSWFLRRNTADLGKSILSEVSLVVQHGLAPLLELISKTMITVAIIILLTLVNFKLTIVTSLTFISFYVLIYLSGRKFLKIIGKKRLNSNFERFKVVSEVFGAAKEVKLAQLEKVYIDNYSLPAQIYAKSQAQSIILNQLPRHFIEIIAFGGMLLVILYLMSWTGSFNEALPIITLFAFAAYRLMPALQQIYGSIVLLRFLGPAVNDLSRDIQSFSPKNSYLEIKENLIELNKEIRLTNITYQYPETSEKILDNINLTVPAKKTVGIIGLTGSGKTTIVDIMIGLLEPQSGKLEVDHKEITKQYLRSWQRSIGYVPQQIFLSDDTVKSNIAFGIDPKKINMDALEAASKKANIHEFIINSLPEKYNTIIGERGIRLSGGQRQRIGIARALYHKPQVLVLDEATSALDSHTEKVVMEAIQNLGKTITLIIITHRLSTLKDADLIFLIEDGKVKKRIDQSLNKKQI